MSLQDRIGSDPTTLVARAIQLVLVGLVGYGAVAGKVSLLVNGVLGLGVTLLPAALERRYDHEVDPRLAVWIGVAVLVHVVGFLGLYGIHSGPLAWYDQVAHSISAGFVAGVGYALVEALDRGTERVRFPEGFRFVFTLAFILAFGVAWEIVEFAGGAVAVALGGEEVLVQYGLDDTVLDLAFNTLAGAIVALWGTGYFDDVAAIFADRVSRRT